MIPTGVTLLFCSTEVYGHWKRKGATRHKLLLFGFSESPKRIVSGICAKVCAIFVISSVADNGATKRSSMFIIRFQFVFR